MHRFSRAGENVARIGMCTHSDHEYFVERKLVKMFLCWRFAGWRLRVCFEL